MLAGACKKGRVKLVPPPQDLLVLPDDDQAVKEDALGERSLLVGELCLWRREMQMFCKNIGRVWNFQCFAVKPDVMRRVTSSSPAIVADIG